MYDDLTAQVISSAFEVHNTLGSGFLEKVYENALLVELREKGLKAESQKPVTVLYKDRNVGEYFADIIVGDKVVLELKAIEKIDDIHEIQLKNYLKATGIEVGLLINFGKSVEVKRKYVKNPEIIKKE